MEIIGIKIMGMEIMGMEVMVDNQLHLY